MRRIKGRDAAFRERRVRGYAWHWAVAGILAAAAGLGGCASTSESIADRASQSSIIGLPADAPARPVDPVTYPAVHDMPPPRPNTVLTGMEQQKLEADLVAARDRQQAAAGIKPAGRKTKDAKSVRRSKPAEGGSTAN